MQRDQLLVAEMIDAAERILELIGESTADEVDTNRDRRDAVLWNFTVLGEAASKIGDATREAFPNVGVARPRPCTKQSCPRLCNCGPRDPCGSGAG